MNTLGVASFEEFISAGECAEVVSRMSRYVAGLPQDQTSHCERSTSVHHVPGLGLRETMLAYEPRGRLEVSSVPVEVERLLARAADRALGPLRRSFPAAARMSSWTYLEYHPGQYITPHIDMCDNPDDPEHPQLAGISICLNDDYAGGEFVLGTTSHPGLWRADEPGLVVTGADYTSDWFRGLAVTEWVCRPRAGTALFYGSQLIHSTRPVIDGLVKKVIGFVYA